MESTIFSGTKNYWICQKQARMTVSTRFVLEMPCVMVCDRSFWTLTINPILLCKRTRMTETTQFLFIGPRAHVVTKTVYSSHLHLCKDELSQPCQSGSFLAKSKFFFVAKVSDLVAYNPGEEELRRSCHSGLFLARSIIFCVAKNSWLHPLKWSRSQAGLILPFWLDSGLMIIFSVDQDYWVNNP